MNVRRISLVLFCTMLCVFLVGCTSSYSFTWKLTRVPTNLDPQIAIESPELIAITNLYRGLTRIDESGQPVLDCAADYTVSSDGLTYTFTLKDGLTYNKLKKQEKEYSVTAGDFVFGMQRVFLPETQSPYTSVFRNLKNATKVLDGSADISQLGVSASDDKTVVFQLEQPDDEFLYKLSQPGAMPCNKEFFDSTAGTYGLTAQTTLANGWFYLYNWNDNGLFLRRNVSEKEIGSLRLVLDTDSTDSTSSVSSSSSSSASTSTPLTGAQKVENGIATAAIDSSDSTGNLSKTPYTATTWALLFNTNNKQLAPIDVRKSLIASAASVPLQLPGNLSNAEGLVPPAVTIQGESYRTQVGNQLLSVSGNIRDLCRSGLESAGLKRFDGIQILIPQGSDYQQLISQINQQWQQDLGSLSAYFSIKELPQDQLLDAVQKGEYQIALVPFTATSNNPLELLGQFTNGAYTQTINSSYDSAFAQLSDTFQPSAQQISALENQLLQQAAVYPLWYQEQAFVVAPGVEHVVFQPFGPVLDLTWTTYTK